MLDFAQSHSDAPDDLVRRVIGHRLCRLADFRRAKISVRQLSRDLPPFDSVWIDALVQLRKLTQFQARMLENGAEAQLLIGDYVVVDRWGQGPHGTTLIAKSPQQRETVALKRISVAAEVLPDCRQRLRQLVERSRTWSHPNLVVPNQLLVQPDGELVTVSRQVSGLTLAELLIRRGRFPAPVVLEIARQLASGLASLHAQGLTHGDLMLSNVRLTTSGMAILVDGGIRPALYPELTIHEELALDAYDGIAPELIGTGLHPNASSEIYALGCLLWQLLTGRPPYPTADALMKLAAHQTQQIADVRSLAPDTPAALAETIAAMTSPEINERPKSVDELLHRWGRAGLTSRSRLKRYRQHFDGAVPHFVHQRAPVMDSRWPWMAASLFVAAGMALTFADKGLRSEFLAITHRVSETIQTSLATNPVPSDAVVKPGEEPVRSNGLLPLPAPVDGEIVLDQAGPYEVARIVVDGNLTIRGAAGVTPVIQVKTESLWLAGTNVKLQNVAIACDYSARSGLKAAVLVKSKELEIKGCLFRQVSDDATATGIEMNRQSTAIGWGPLDAAEADQWRVVLSDCVFQTNGAALWSAEMPHQITMHNCLKAGSGPCVAVSPRASFHQSQWELKNVTLRESGPLLRLAGNYAENSLAPTIEMTANDCVFAGGPSTSLIELQAAAVRENAAKVVSFRGEGCVIAPKINLLAACASPTSQIRAIADADEQFEGIVVSELIFAGAIKGSIVQSRLENLTAPRSSAQKPPGVDVSQLPADAPR
ncbi:MAG TPA: serine/threonine-protein kinase [Schlesneria sp.]